jgi:hypothetical protein
MDVGDGRYKFSEKNFRVDRGWWVNNRYICLACALPKYGTPPPELIKSEKDLKEFGTVNRYLRPIILE